MLRASLRACSTLSRVAALAVPRPPLLAAASVRDRPSSSLQSWSVAPPPSETPPREPLLLGGLLGACLPRCPPPPPPPPAPCGRGHTRSSVRRGRPCARPAQLARARRADGDGQGPEAYGQAVGASGQDTKIRQVRTAAAAAHAPASACAAASSPSPAHSLRTARALGPPLAEHPSCTHGERRRARGTPGEATGPNTVPTLGRSLAKLSIKRNAAGRKLKRGR